MKKQYGWVSEYKRKKFFEGQELRKEKEFKKKFGVLNDSDIPKTIAIMLDLDGTCDFINDEKAKRFIAQIEILRKKFGAKYATISISTHYDRSDRIQEILNLLSRHLSRFIKIGISFFYGGIYDYEKKEEVFKGYPFNQNKVKTFEEYYVNNIGTNNQWFALIDDGLLEDTYSRYKDTHPMVVCRPSQRNETSLLKNNFMSISTTTRGIDGVIEALGLYIESIRQLSPLQIMENQRNMITHLSSWDLTKKIIDRDYGFLKRYFEEGYADDADYKDALNWLICSNSELIFSKEELIYLRQILKLMSFHFEQIKEKEFMEHLFKLQRVLEMDNK